MLNHSASLYACKLIPALMFAYVHGAVCPAVFGVDHVLLASLRDGDVTVHNIFIILRSQNTE